MSARYPRLLSPLTVGTLSLPNRVLMAPMTRSRAADGNVPGPLAAEYYAQRASAGLIISEATQVSQQGVGYPWTPGIHTDAQQAGWRRVTDAVHAAGGRIFAQLWHVGRVSLPMYQREGGLPVAPSAIAAAGQAFTANGPVPYGVPRALETSEIPGIVADFAASAKRALAAGFDGIELHGANGYLIDQFLRDGSNHRTDTYGGSLANRARFLMEIVEAVTPIWDGDRVGVRLSLGHTSGSLTDSDPIALATFVGKELDRFDLAYVHLIEAIGGPMAPSMAVRVAPALRDAFRGALFLNGGYDAPAAEAALSEGRADAVSFGMPFLANPDLPRRFAEGAGLNAPDFATFYGGGAKGYTDYPALR